MEHDQPSEGERAAVRGKLVVVPRCARLWARRAPIAGGRGSCLLVLLEHPRETLDCSAIASGFGGGRAGGAHSGGGLAFLVLYRTRLASKSSVRRPVMKDSLSTLPLMVSPLMAPWNLECDHLFVSVGWRTLLT
jgi:hypothetical protein